MSRRAKAFIGVTIATGFLFFGYALSQWQSADLARFFSYLAVAILVSGLKVCLPGIDGTMSVNFLFILLGIMELSLPETMLIGCGACLMQCVWNTRKSPEFAKVAFNISMMATAVAIAYFTYHRTYELVHRTAAMLLMAAALVFFIANTVPVSIVIAITESKSWRKIWSECYFWSFPYYLVGAAVVALVGFVNRQVGWQASLLSLPVIYLVYRSYRLYLERLEQEKKHVEVEKQHVEQMAALHVRTIEALALAIDAKDHTTHKHLNRVRTYAMKMGEELGLSTEEQDALRAASLLHDIGKLAVPEPIINKPGKLTPEEFERMKIHPVVGAEILERVKFPYPVAPIVRSHHEKWDGSGYPEGLKGEEIPIGARILAAVDCLDALASDRQYRTALPLHEAMKRVSEMAGTAFDPRITKVLEKHCVEWERLAQSQSAEMAELGLLSNLRVERGLAPDAGFEQAGLGSSHGTRDFLSSIAAARQEAQTLFELSQDLGNSLSLSETLSVLSLRMSKLIPCDTIATFICRDHYLVPELVSGDNFRLFAALQIPIGDGLCGWVARNLKPIINGNPAVESGYVADEKSAILRSAIAVPLEGVKGIVGVLALYKAEADFFTTDHLRILQAVSSKVALSIENALRYQQAENSAVTDYLTGLPNARSLFMHLDKEIARCQRTNTSVAVMVCDLDGFKQINDCYGHMEGDKALRYFAKHLKDTSREYDYVARMGGDEFVIVAPGLKSEAVADKVAQMNALAVEAGRQACGKEILSLSVGTAFCPQDGYDAERLLSEADRRMYTVKQLHHQHSSSINHLIATRATWTTVH